MKVIDLNGKAHNFPPTGHQPDYDDWRRRSEPHLHARRLLKELYPTQRILEEVHGRQHYEFVAHFHKDRWGFSRSKQNDSKKEEWCSINNIKYIVLPYNNVKEWNDIISES